MLPYCQCHVSRFKMIRITISRDEMSTGAQLTATAKSTNVPSAGSTCTETEKNPLVQREPNAVDTRARCMERVRHAARCAAGALIISGLAVSSAPVSGCTAAILFFISTIAGTPEPYQGFQLRSAALSFVGALLGGLAYVVVAAIAPGSEVALFFCCVPFVVVFSALRTDRSLIPLPAVANVFLGYLVVSKFGESRKEAATIFAAFLIEAAVAWAVAVSVNLVAPDRAANAGRHIIAQEMQNVGAALSAVGSRTFGPGGQRVHLGNTGTSILVEECLHVGAKEAGILDEDYVFLTSNFPRGFSGAAAVAEAELKDIQGLRPFGKTRIANYGSLAEARRLLAMSAFEPCFLKPTVSHWRNVAAWDNLIDCMHALLNKLSSLESVSCNPRSRVPHFTRERMMDVCGEAFLPLWTAHFASCAAACAVMSTAMRNASCSQMFHLVEDESSKRADPRSLHPDLDPRMWTRRRADMYLGILLRHRATWQLGPPENLAKVDEARHRLLVDSDVASVDSNGDSLHEDDDSACIGDFSPRRVSEYHALSFFGITSHSMSEEIAHLQRAMILLAESQDKRTVFAPLRFVYSAFPVLLKRFRTLAKGEVEMWELRFILAHSLLLLSVLSLALFLPLRDRFEAAEFGWVFSSAALSAQLTAEPTVFIGTIRVFATMTGAAFALGYNSLLNVAGRAENPDVQYAAMAYIPVMTMMVLLLASDRYRYASFLFIATNAVVLFCPRAGKACAISLSNPDPSCFPDWKYAVSRSVNVSIGVVFAVLFHLLFWPRFAHKVARKDLSTAFINASRLYGKLHRTYFAYGSHPERGGGGGQTLAPSVLSSPVVADDRRRIQSSLLSQADVYLREQPMLDEVQERVGNFVASALDLVKTEASVWQSGPLQVSPILPRILPDFLSLSVSLSEMAGILGRRPIFCGSYSRTAHDLYIKPLLYMYETTQVSLHNLVGSTQRALTDGSKANLKDLSLDLHEAVAHLARSRAMFRREVQRRAALTAFAAGRTSASLSATRKHPSQSRVLGSHSLDDLGPIATEMQGFMRAMHSSGDSPDRESTLPISVSLEDVRLKTMREEGTYLTSDDTVLFNAFTFVADGSLSAFVRIARVVLRDAEERAAALQAHQELARQRHANASTLHRHRRKWGFWQRLRPTNGSFEDSGLRNV